MDPTLIVLVSSAAAAACGALGALPLVGRQRLPVRWIGLANALAGGMMLGFAYMLTATGAGGRPLATALGAVGGILFTYWTHAFQGTDDLELNQLQASDPSYGYKILSIGALHSASEGVAIGVAMAIDLSFGLSMAVAIALHNVAEGTVLQSILHGLGVGPGRAAILGAAVNGSQVLLAVATFAVVSAAPATLPAGLGFAVGALVYLVMVELLPESYREAGETSVGLVVLAAMGTVVLLGRLVP